LIRGLAPARPLKKEGVAVPKKSKTMGKVRKVAKVANNIS